MALQPGSLGLAGITDPTARPVGGGPGPQTKQFSAQQLGQGLTQVGNAIGQAGAALALQPGPLDILRQNRAQEVETRARLAQVTSTALSQASKAAMQYGDPMQQKQAIRQMLAPFAGLPGFENVEQFVSTIEASTADASQMAGAYGLAAEYGPQLFALAGGDMTKAAELMADPKVQASIFRGQDQQAKQEMALVFGQTGYMPRNLDELRRDAKKLGLEDRHVGAAERDPNWQLAQGMQTPELMEYEAKLRMKAAIDPERGSVTTIKMAPGETEMQKAEGKAVGEAETTVLPNLRKQLGQVEALQGLLDKGTETGGWEQLQLDAANFFGVESEALSDLAAFRAVAGSAILTKSAELKGPTSDRDINFIRQGVANAGNSPEANKAILKMQKKLLEREAEYIKQRSSYYRGRGTLEGFDDYITAWGDAHPLFSEGEQASLGKQLAKQEEPEAGGEQINEGTVIENDAGERMILRKGKWESYRGP